MHQTRKGQQWYFGIKLHIGVDSQSGLTRSAVVTAANVHDKHPLPDLLHGQERRVYGDSAYASQRALIEGNAPKAKTSRTSAPGGAASWTTQSNSKIEASHAFGRAWSMCLAWSSGYGALARCATAAWPRTPHAHSRPWHWPTSTLADNG